MIGNPSNHRRQAVEAAQVEAQFVGREVDEEVNRRVRIKANAERKRVEMFQRDGRTFGRRVGR